MFRVSRFVKGPLRDNLRLRHNRRPADSHPPISYPLAIVAGHDGKDAQDFRAFLMSDTAKAIYKKFGFTVK